jgi:poly(3-hydroxybutyrate) depolymerase
MRNYATVSMDSGHWGASLADGRWAYNNLVGKFDWGRRAVTMTARVTKSIIQNYYGKPSSKSYFNGCSTGGRMAHMEAWKYPEDFDGIISGAPAVDYTGLVATFFAWVTQATPGRTASRSRSPRSSWSRERSTRRAPVRTASSRIPANARSSQ